MSKIDLKSLSTPELIQKVGEILESRGCTSLLVIVSPYDFPSAFHTVSVVGPDMETSDEWSSKIASSIHKHSQKENMEELRKLLKNINRLKNTV